MNIWGNAIYEWPLGAMTSSVAILPNAVENPTFWKNSYVNIRHNDIVKMTQFFILKSKKRNISKHQCLFRILQSQKQ